jgi:hypothetical protein
MKRLLFDTNLAHAVTTIHSLARKKESKAKRVVTSILRVFRVAAVDAAAIQEALDSGLSDFEDSVTPAAARVAGCDFIVTRDPRGFRQSSVRPITPEAADPLL